MTAVAIGSLLGRRKSKLNPEFPSDPVRAVSWDVDDPRANPQRPIGDGSAGFGWAFGEALVKTAQALQEEHRAETYDGPHPVQRTHVDVLRAMLTFLTYKTGELIAPYKVIAEKALVSESTAKRAVEVLEFWGLLAHVRRSVKIEGAEKTAAPQRKQAPNSYFFDCRRSMPASIWTRFWSRVLFNLRRVGAAAAKRAAKLRHTFNEKAVQAPRCKNRGLAEVLDRMRRDHFADPPQSTPSASSKEDHYPGLKA